MFQIAKFDTNRDQRTLDQFYKLSSADGLGALIPSNRSDLSTYHASQKMIFPLSKHLKCVENF